MLKISRLMDATYTFVSRSNFILKHITQGLFLNDTNRAKIKRVLQKEANLSTNDVDKVLNYEYYLKNIKKIFKRLEL